MRLEIVRIVYRIKMQGPRISRRKSKVFLMVTGGYRSDENCRPKIQDNELPFIFRHGVDPVDENCTMRATEGV